MAFLWNDETDARLYQLFIVEVRSAAVVATMLGKPCTRNSVVGRAHRLGYHRTEVAIEYCISARQKRITARAPPTRSKKTKPMPTLPDTPGGLTLMQLGPSQCRWPLNSPRPRAEYLFCGAKTQAGATYCPACARRAYQPKRAA